MIPLAPHVTAFFQERLPQERRASPHTVESYAYAFKLLLTFASARVHVPPSDLRLEHIDAPLVVDFLNHLEQARGNGPSSRNVRLAAIKSFMHFLEYREPSALERIRRILAIPLKKADTRLVRHLTVDFYFRDKPEVEIVVQEAVSPTAHRPISFQSLAPRLCVSAQPCSC